MISVIKWLLWARWWKVRKKIRQWIVLRLHDHIAVVHGATCEDDIANIAYRVSFIGVCPICKKEVFFGELHSNIPELDLFKKRENLFFPREIKYDWRVFEKI